MSVVTKLSAEDRLDVIELMVRYGRTLDARDAAGYAALFAPDAVRVTGNGARVQHGRAEIQVDIQQSIDGWRATIRHFLAPPPLIEGGEGWAALHGSLVCAGNGRRARGAVLRVPGRRVPGRLRVAGWAVVLPGAQDRDDAGWARGCRQARLLSRDLTRSRPGEYPTVGAYGRQGCEADVSQRLSGVTPLEQPLAGSVAQRALGETRGACG